jgi:hypothetical protein
LGNEEGWWAAEGVTAALLKLDEIGPDCGRKIVAEVRLRQAEATMNRPRP